MIVIEEGNFYIDQWFLNGINQDVMGVVYVDKDVTLKYVFRTRDYNSPDPFDKKDTKVWNEVTYTGNKGKPITPEDIKVFKEQVKKFNTMFAEEANLKITHVELNCNHIEYFNKIKDLKFVHTRKATEEDLRDIEKEKKKWK